VTEYIEHYNAVRLHSAIGYVAPIDKLNCRDKEIFNERDRKLEAAREQRRIRGQQHYDSIKNHGEDSSPLTHAA
jgi:hypothetical protein